MINLATGETIRGVASVTDSVTYTITGMELSDLLVESYQVLSQGELPTAAGILYTAPSTNSAFIKTIFMANTTNDLVSVTLYINGTTTSHQIGTWTILGNKGQVIQ